MIEYIANRVNENREKEAVRFIGIGKFAMLKDGTAILIPDDYDKDLKEVLGDDFEGISEFRTFYDEEAGQFRLMKYQEGMEIPQTLIPIPYDGGEIAGWQIGRLDERMHKGEEA